MGIPATWQQDIIAFVALISLILSPFVSFRIAGKQIRANVVSLSRQKWIDALRDDISELLTLAADLALLEHRLARAFDIPRDVELKRIATQRARLLDLRIRLRLNPREQDHEELRRMIDSLLRTERPVDDLLPEGITTASQAIFKREWERVKAGD
jgi:hypothetical protein